MKRLLFLSLFGLLTVASTVAEATSFTLDFSGLQPNEEVLTYYDGGFGSLDSTELAQSWLVFRSLQKASGGRPEQNLMALQCLWYSAVRPESSSTHSLTRDS